MPVAKITIDCDADGFHLILEGDYIGYDEDDRLDLLLSQGAAVNLVQEVREKIEPWWEGRGRQ